MTEAIIESGFAKVEAGTWLAGCGQPAATLGTARATGLKGLFVADRPYVRRVETTGAAWFARAEAPFLTRIDARPDEPTQVVSAKVLVAPFAARTGAQTLKLIPLSFQRATAVTDFRQGWAVAATKSRVTRVALDDEAATLTVRPEALVAWSGPKPTGFCPRLTALDVILPRAPRDLSYTFHAPAVVWFEGAAAEGGRRGRFRAGRGAR